MSVSLGFVVPCKDGSGFLERCLSSVVKARAAAGLDQESCPIVVVDDQSRFPQQTAEAAERVGAVSLKTLPGHGCPGGARNVGMDALKTDYVWFVDCDDLLTEDAVQKVLEALAKAPGVDVLGIPFKTLKPDGKEEVAMCPWRSIEEAVQGPVAPWSKVVKRAVCPRFEEETTAEDTLWHYELMDGCRSYEKLEVAVYLYDRSRKGALTDASEWCARNLLSLERLALHDDLEKAGLPVRWPADAWRCVAGLYMFVKRAKNPVVRRVAAIRLHTDYVGCIAGSFGH